MTFSGPFDEGNSGGPLLIDGKVIGVITEKSGDFGFAAPALFVDYALKGWGVKTAKAPSRTDRKHTETNDSLSPPPHMPQSASIPKKDRAPRRDPESTAQTGQIEMSRTFPSKGMTAPPDSAPFLGADFPQDPQMSARAGAVSFELGRQAFLGGNFPLALEYWHEAAAAAIQMQCF